MKASRPSRVVTGSTCTVEPRRGFWAGASAAEGTPSAAMGSWASSDMYFLRERRSLGSLVVVGHSPGAPRAAGQFHELVGALDDGARHVAQGFLDHLVELVARGDLEVCGPPGGRLDHVEDPLREPAGGPDGAILRRGPVGGGHEARRVGARVVDRAHLVDH